MTGVEVSCTDRLSGSVPGRSDRLWSLPRFALFSTAGTGPAETSLRPPAVGSAISPVAARTRQPRSGPAQT